MMLLGGKDGIEYVTLAVTASLNVIGIEGFRLLPSGAIQPDLRLTVGVQNSRDSAEIHRKVLETLNTWKDDACVVFEIYLEEDTG